MRVVTRSLADSEEHYLAIYISYIRFFYIPINGKKNWITIAAKIKAPHILKNKNIFTAGFLFPWGQGLARTEAVIAKKSTFASWAKHNFKVRSLQSDKNYLYVEKQTTWAYLDASV